MASILIIGSSNTDMVIRVPVLPRPGETVTGGDFQTFGGGKGANQAVAARRAGGDVQFIAAIGDDDFGKAAIDLYSAEGIDTAGIQVISGVPSGAAMIFVNDTGQNSIAVAPGANAWLSPEFLHGHQHAFDDADLLLMQLEIPLATVAVAVKMANTNRTPVILNPAPAAALPDSVLESLFCITPNEMEAEALTGIAVSDQESAIAAAEALLQRGVENVVITLGSRGALLHSIAGTHFQTAEKVTAVDTTGAGDTFNGVFAAMVAAGRSPQEAVEIAVRAATISVQTAGAIASIPVLESYR